MKKCPSWNPDHCIVCGEEKSHYIDFPHNKFFSNVCQACMDQSKKWTHAFWMWARAKQRAYSRGLPFDITPEDIHIPTHCPVLGIKFVGPGSATLSEVASLDKIIPSKGYVKGNIAVISYRANRIKNDASAEELETIATWIRSMTAEPDPVDVERPITISKRI